MFLSGLVDLGLSPAVLEAGLRKLKLGPFRMRFPHVHQKAIRARRLNLRLPHSTSTHHGAGDHLGHTHRSHRSIVALIRRSGLAKGVQEKALAVFRVLAEAEGKVHGLEPHRVEFHEVGAIDSLIDIVGAAIGLEELGIEKVYASPLPLGSGLVETRHGTYPVPAPATLELMRGLPTRNHPEPGEWTTPTGAALVRALAEVTPAFPTFRIERIGYGSGTRPGRALPNVVRMVLGTEPARPGATDLERDEVWVLETNLDDLSPELVPAVTDRLFQEGALDVQIFSTHMKHGRPGFMIQILAHAGARDALAQLLLEETPTLGVRFHRAERIKLKRRHVRVTTRFGEIRAKVSARNGEILTVKAEVEDLARAASSAGLPLRRVRDEVDRLLAARFSPRRP